MRRLMLVFLLGVAAQAANAQGLTSSCFRCHQGLEGSLHEAAQLAGHDIHFQKGLSCNSCHGGDPSIGVDSGGPEDAMNPKKGYIGIPPRKRIAALCASCHSKPEFMRTYNPGARVDQYAEYLTSIHGKKYQAGDPNVATCTDCHLAHGIRAVKDPNSSVYPTNVATTCARCHSDKKRMSSYQIPTDQMDLYSKSAHAEALIKKRDLSAPTCNSCHGNHGATPPGVDSVANVCGQCHARQWDLFNESPHKKAFVDGGLPACVTCHRNHDVAHTADAMLGVGDSATCVQCHDKESKGYVIADQMHSGVVLLQTNLDSTRELLQRAERAGMEVSRPLYDLSEGRDRLVLARVENHKFNLPALNSVLAEGGKIALSARQQAEKALADLAFRRKGLAISAGILLLMIGLLVAKIRQTAKRPD
jgi:predicted CXXCH cytochrome family protein